jgi:carbon-monoxide dehydrogenase medium subunit
LRELTLVEPTTVEEAVRHLDELGDEAKVLGGGTAVVLMFNQGLIAPRYLVSLAKIAELDGIRDEPGVGLHLGASTTHRTVERSATVRRASPLLADVFHQIANVRVRNQATVGGVVAEADYASDPPAALVALGAQVHLTSVGGRRTVPMDGFVRDFFETVIEPNEIVTGISIPPLREGSRTAYIKFKSRSSEDRACVSVAAVARMNGERCDGLRVVVGAVAETPQELTGATALAKGERLTDELADEIARRYADGIEPIADVRGSSWYRRRVIRVQVRRTIQQLARSQGGAV